VHDINKQVAESFRLKADQIEQSGKNVYRALAFRKAADALEQYPESLLAMYKRSWIKGIEKIPSLGPRLARVVEQELKRQGISRP
jgi:DNA polymerase (family X)